MPATTRPYVPHYEAPPLTQENLEYADLAVIDLSKADTPEGKAALVNEVRDALSTTGFFYIVGHGYTQEETDRIYDIADVPLTQVSDEEKQAYLAKQELGTFQGYKLRNYWHIDNGVPDQIEYYGVSSDLTKKSHPIALRPFIPEIQEFTKFNHKNVLHGILRLLALGLELPEDAFVKLHSFEADGESHARFMKYYPRDEIDEEKTKNVWLKGHTDFGSIAILWSQPVAGLQILSPDEKWRWVKHIPNALIINAGDSMEFFSGGYYKATIHRVVQPPADQRMYTRLGVFYFATADNTVRLTPFTESPVLQRVGVKRRFPDTEAPTVDEWRKARTIAYGVSKLTKEDSGHEVEIVKGIEVKHYN